MSRRDPAVQSAIDHLTALAGQLRAARGPEDDEGSSV